MVLPPVSGHRRRGLGRVVGTFRPAGRRERSPTSTRPSWEEVPGHEHAEHTGSRTSMAAIEALSDRRPRALAATVGARVDVTSEAVIERPLAAVADYAA